MTFRDRIFLKNSGFSVDGIGPGVPGRKDSDHPHVCFVPDRALWGCGDSASFIVLGQTESEEKTSVTLFSCGDV